MSKFKVEKAKEGSALLIKLGGAIDEDAVFENISFDNSPAAVVDLDQVRAINSCGIREWVKWVRSYAGQMTFRNCPKVIVDQINMVNGFLPENATVESFYVPYFNEESGNEKMVLFKKGENFGDGGVNPPDLVKDDETGSAMEMDVIEAKYFKFIK